MFRALAMTLVLAAPAVSIAQAPEGRATLYAGETTVRVGDLVHLEVHVEPPETTGGEWGLELPAQPELEVVDRRAEILSDGAIALKHFIVLRAVAPGTFTLGPWSLRAGGIELSTNAVTITVEPAEVSTVQVIDESQAGAQIVERGYVRGVGRGVQYGAHIISPIYLTDVRGTMGERTAPEGGVGIWARIGWEFPIGFTLEILGGLAANGVDTRGFATDPAFMRADVGLGARYMFFNDTAFVPFIQIGGTVRFFFFDWVQAPPALVDAATTGALHGAVGAQIELSPFFGIEAGLAFDYTFAAEIFAEGLISLMPFVGVTFYIYDESGN